MTATDPEASVFPVVVDSRDLQDVDAMAAAIADGMGSEYVQLEARPFKGRWTVISLPSMVVQFAHAEIAIVRRLRVPLDRLAFVIPLHVPGLARWNGHTIRGGEVIVCPGGGDDYAFDPGGMQFAILSVPAAVSSEFVDAECLAAADGSASCVLRPSTAESMALRRRLADLQTAAEGKGARDRETIEEAAGGVSERLIKCLRRNLPHGRGANAAARSMVVRRAEQFFRCHVGEPVSIAQLSTIAGVSERSLRNAFYHVCTTSPKRYLKLWQLHEVRRALRGGERPPLSVTDVATLHGFFELGRFAGEYKALFGEAPSQTLQRSRTTIVPPAHGAA
jgi:AraC family transcriptional regulator, ethanolamine operon transcriptional activator